MEPDSQFPKLSFATINCNSLNMSSIGNMNHLLKIYGITSLKTDIILLSDIRMCNNVGISNLSDLTKSFKINPHCSYKFFHNSKRNKRGVGILIKHSLSFAVLGETRDPDDNYLALHLEFEGKIFTVSSIYGPNQAQPAFFASLQECVSNFGNHPVIMGGDWNCTVSCEPAVSNLDTLNMQNPPNLRHSNLLRKMCQDLNLSDPFSCEIPVQEGIYLFFEGYHKKKNPESIFLSFRIVCSQRLTKTLFNLICRIKCLIIGQLFYALRTHLK
jgi:exonuclease III